MKKTDSYRFRGLLVGAFLALILLLSFLACLLLPFLKKDHSVIATITQHGNVLYTIPLEEVTAEYELTISGDNGNFNVILVSPGSIRMKEASCPDKLCIKAGVSGNSLLPIICLPNEISITLTYSSQDKMDAITY